MSVAWYIVLERSMSGFDHGVNGKSIAKAGKMLEKLAAEAKIRPLMTFFGASPDDLRAFSEDAAVDAQDFPEEEWFNAAEGLETVYALIEAVEQTTYSQKDDVVSELHAFRSVLETAKDQGVRWHLAVDY